MAGLIDVGILKPELAGSFAAGYRGAEKARQEAEQARQQSERTQQQIAQGRQQMQMDEFTLQKLREDRAALTDLQAKLRSAGQSDDPKLFFQTLINTGNPDYMNKGYEGLQRYKELQQADQVLRQFAPEMFVNAATPAKPITAMAPGALGSGTFGVMPEPINALAPKVTETPQPTNAMVAAPVADNAPDVNALRRQLFMLSSVNDPRAKAMADVIKGQITEASKPYVVGGRLVTGAGKELYTAPEKAPAPTKNIANINPNDFTPASIQKFSQSGNYADLVSKKPVGTGEGAATKAPAGYRFTKSGDLEAIPGGPAAGKPLTELQQLKLKKDFAADTTNVKSSMTTADELEKLTDELVGNPDKKLPPHPGLSGITGWSALLPSAPSGNAIKAEQKLETFKGKIKALGRQLASQEGKLGNMAVQEWKMVSDAVQAIDPRAGNLDVQMRDVVRQARDLAGRMQEKFDLTYEDQTRPATPATPPAVVPDKAGGPAMPAKPGANLTPAEQAELEQLRQRFRK